MAHVENKAGSLVLRVDNLTRNVAAYLFRLANVEHEFKVKIQVSVYRGITQHLSLAHDTDMQSAIRVVLTSSIKGPCENIGSILAEGWVQALKKLPTSFFEHLVSE